MQTSSNPKYEFSPEQNKSIATTAYLLLGLGSLGLLYGIIVIIQAFGASPADGTSPWEMLIRGGAYVIAAVSWLRPIDNLRRIVTTQGHDVEELTTALTEMKNAVIVVNILVVVAILGLAYTLFI